MRIYAVLLLAIGFVTTLCAQPAASYYTSEALDGKSGRDLELALSAIVYPHTRISYDDLWDKFPTTDPGPADSIPAGAKYTDLVYDMYAWMGMRPHYYSDGDHEQTTGINREHAVPNSWWGAKAGNTEAYSDLHHLMPADGKANNKKSDYPLGTGAGIEGSTFTYTENSGCHLWTVTADDDGYGGGASRVWEPSDEYKGDFARMYLYLACAYEGKLMWQTNYMFESDDQHYTTIKPWAKDVLLQWHRQDRISDKERARNNAVESIQQNRNPFVDYPELVEYIWGNKSGEAFTLANAVSSYSDEYSHPQGEKTAHIYFARIARIGMPFKAPKLTTNSDGALTYSSSNPDVAEVNVATGEVTIKAEGTAVITVTQAETATFTAASASYMIKVIK